MLRLPRGAVAVLLLAVAGASMTLIGNLALGVTDPDPGKAELRYLLSVGNHASNTLLAGLGFWTASRYQGRVRTAVTCFSAGLLGYAIGNWTWLSYNLRGVDAPYPSVADGAYLMLPILASVGLGILLRESGRRREGIDLAVGILLPLSVLVAFYAFVIDPRLGEPEGWRTFFDLAYPVLDAVVIGLAGLLVYFARPTPLTPTIRRLAGSIALLTAADVALITRTAAGVYFTGDWVDSLYVVASFAYGATLLSLAPLAVTSPPGQAAARGSSA